jgi:hypothetical protein
MNSSLSVIGLLWLVAAVGLAWIGWQRGNRIVTFVAVLMLIVAAWNVTVYIRRHE